MNALVNVVFVLAGVFLAGYTAFFARHATRRSQSLLLGLCLGGALLLALRIPLAVGPGGAFASGGFAIAAGGAAVLDLLRELRIEGGRSRAPQRVGVATSTSILTVSSLMWWVAVHAP